MIQDELMHCVILSRRGFKSIVYQLNEFSFLCNPCMCCSAMVVNTSYERMQIAYVRSGFPPAHAWC